MNGLVSKINCSLSLCALDRNSTGLKPVVFLFSQEREDHAWKSSVVSFLTLTEDFKATGVLTIGNFMCIF